MGDTVIDDSAKDPNKGDTNHIDLERDIIKRLPKGQAQRHKKTDKKIHDRKYTDKNTKSESNLVVEIDTEDD